MPDCLHWRFRLDGLHGMSAVRQYLVGLIGEEADQLLAAGCLEVGLLQRALAEKIGLLLRDQS